MKCGVKNCNVDFEPILDVIDNGVQRYAICPNHQLMQVFGHVPNEDIEKLESSGELVVCELCDADHALHIQTEDKTVNLNLCQAHYEKLIRLNLSPEEFKRLEKKHGIFHLIHDDFYDEEGYALQPR